MSNNIFLLFGRALCKYASISGRASRREFWSFVLVNYLIWNSLLFIFVDLETSAYETSFSKIDFLIFFLYPLTMLPPLVCVWCRRIHDVGLSAWFILVPLYNIVLLFLPSKQGYNPYEVISSKGSCSRSWKRPRMSSSVPMPSTSILKLLSFIGTTLFTVACTLHEAMLMHWIHWEVLEEINRYLWLLGGATILLSRLLHYLLNRKTEV